MTHVIDPEHALAVVISAIVYGVVQLGNIALKWAAMREAAKGMSRTLSDADVAAIADAVFERMNTKPAEAPPPTASADDIITSAEAMNLLRVTSPTALCRMVKKLRIRRLSQNRYRRGDIENAIARATHMPRAAK